MSDHGPIEQKHRAMMNGLADGLDDILNSDPTAPRVGFALLVFPLNQPGRMNYVSNGHRSDMIVALKEFLARNEGQYFEGGKA